MSVTFYPEIAKIKDDNGNYIPLPGFASSADATNLASEFDTSKAYGVGEYVLYQGQVYKFVKAHEAGSWKSAEVEAAKLGGEIASANAVETHYDYVGPLMQVAESYLHAAYDAGSRLTYSSQHGLFAAETQENGVDAIVCSQFVEACLYGIYHSQSRYVQDKNEWSPWGLVTEQYGGYRLSSDTTRQDDKAYFTKSGDVYTKYTGALEPGVEYWEYENPIFAEDCIDDYMTARRLARYCEHFGWLKEYDAERDAVGLEPVRSAMRSKKIRPGDILFFVPVGDTRSISNVTHCAICVAPYKTFYITVESAGPHQRHIDGADIGVFLNKRFFFSDDSNFRPIAYYARIPLQPAAYHSTLVDRCCNLVKTYSSNSTVAISRYYDLPSGLYTLICRDYSVGQTFYIGVTYDDGTSGGYVVTYNENNFEKIGDCCYFVFYAELPIKKINYREYKGSTPASAQYNIADIRLYQGYHPYDA